MTSPETFKKKLLQLQKELIEIEKSSKQSTQPVELDQSRVGRLSRMDALQTQAISIESKRRLTQQKQNIRTALERIDNNEYGICLQCGEEINHKRLEFDPTTALCINCANKKEA